MAVHCSIAGDSKRRAVSQVSVCKGFIHDDLSIETWAAIRHNEEDIYMLYGAGLSKMGPEGQIPPTS